VDSPEREALERRGRKVELKARSVCPIFLVGSLSRRVFLKKCHLFLQGFPPPEQTGEGTGATRILRAPKW